MYQWNFGDGNTSNLDDPVHQYGGPGLYNVTLTMTNLNGCSQTATAQLDIFAAPDADFDYANGCEGSGIQFTNQSTIASGNISTYIWDFGDGSPFSGTVNPVHTFDSSGVFTVTLIAISDNGCADTISQQITIYPTPVSNFNYSEDAGCGPLTISFTDSSFISSGTIVAWSWDFGNGQTSQLQNPTTVYTASGTYGVTLTVTSDRGCTQTFTQPNIITIYPGPVADFVPEPFEASILNPVFEFNNLSQGGSVYSWSFGDGGTSSVFEPTHTYADTGYYPVHLVVVNSYGCIDTITRWVHIVPEFIVYVPNAFTPNSDGVNDFFTLKGLGIEEVTVNIFNRWGENVYTFTNLDEGWNGTVQKNNEMAQQDVYVYNARIKDVFGITHTKSGRVTLVR
jgi:gliding motility-associated-like protein